ncbi:MAG: hypothetical protein D6723_19895 [Acidobacteria bacterium]|nr:MAG: hypothetical protein D6723_19895 [Acidobacteriota bacterium]
MSGDASLARRLIQRDDYSSPRSMVRRRHISTGDAIEDAFDGRFMDEPLLVLSLALLPSIGA